VTEANSVVGLDAKNGIVWAQEAGFGSSRVFPFDLATGERLPGELNGHHGTACDVAVSPDGKSIAVASCNEGVVAVWALDGRTATGKELAPRRWAIDKNSWTPNGARVAVYQLDVAGPGYLVDVHDGTRRQLLDAGFLYFRPDGVVQGLARGTRLVQYDLKTAKLHETGVTFDPDAVSAYGVDAARHLTAFGENDGTLTVVDTERDRVVRKFKTDLGTVFGVEIGADGTRVFAAGQNETAKVFDIASGTPVATLDEPAANLVLSPDRRLLATNRFDGTITFYDADTLKRTGDPLTGATAFTNGMVFTPDGRTLITTGLDMRLRMFDVAARRQIGVAIPVTDVWGVAISPDSKRIAINTERGVSELAIDAGTLRTAACRAAGRNLTAQEWRQYIGGTPRRLCSDWK
jgi:WD40 repeat protein